MQMYSQEVTLPNKECTNCTLQVIQLMSDKPPFGDGNEFYYQCADIVISNGATSGGNDPSGQDSGGCAVSVGEGGAGSIVSLSLLALVWLARGRRARG